MKEGAMAMQMILIGGLWLDGSAWDAVIPHLESAGHRAVPVTLPGQGALPTGATLDDQRGAVLAAIDASAGPVLVVGHSGASTMAWMAGDARVEKVSGLVMIGGFPSADGGTYADFFEVVDGFMAFPGWDPFEGPDSADLDDEAKARMASAAIPVPEGVARGIVHLSDDRRYGLPVTLICPEYSPAQAKEWIDGGEVPELAKARRVEYLDIDSGHWPMFTRPAELAALLDQVAGAGA
jgi:pimeloyl-ACP methyl ester carboxylesterase